MCNHVYHLSLCTVMPQITLFYTIQVISYSHVTNWVCHIFVLASVNFCIWYICRTYLCLQTVCMCVCVHACTCVFKLKCTKNLFLVLEHKTTHFVSSIHLLAQAVLHAHQKRSANIIRYIFEQYQKRLVLFYSLKSWCIYIYTSHHSHWLKLL